MFGGVKEHQIHASRLGRCSLVFVGLQARNIDTFSANDVQRFHKLSVSAADVQPIDGGVGCKFCRVLKIVQHR